MTSMRRRYVASTSLRRHVPAGNLPPPPWPPQYSKPWPPQYSKPSYAYEDVCLVSRNNQTLCLLDFPLNFQQWQQISAIKCTDFEHLFFSVDLFLTRIYMINRSQQRFFFITRFISPNPIGLQESPRSHSVASG